MRYHLMNKDTLVLEFDFYLDEFEEYQAQEIKWHDRTYADIERGTVNMRTETVLRICQVLHITPDEIFTENDTSITTKQAEIIDRLNACSPKDKETALNILSAYLQSLN